MSFESIVVVQVVLNQLFVYWQILDILGYIGYTSSPVQRDVCGWLVALE